MADHTPPRPTNPPPQPRPTPDDPAPKPPVHPQADRSAPTPPMAQPNPPDRPADHVVIQPQPGTMLPVHEAIAPLPSGPMTAEEEAELTAYHEKYMQIELTDAQQVKQAKAGAARMRELLEKKMAWAKSLPSGETGGEYAATKRNLEWLDALEKH